MGAYEEHPVLLPRHGGSSHPEVGPIRPFVCLGWSFVCLAIFVSFMALCWHGDQSRIPPEYSFAFTAVSGLDPVTDTQQGQGLLNPMFNLTIGIASNSCVYGACIEPHTAIKISYSYLHLPLAAGSVPSVCVGPRESRDLPSVVARGRDVAVPGFLIDSLAEELRSGEAMFEVKLVTGSQDGWYDVVTRWVGVGDAAARRGAMHSVGQSSEPIDNMLEPQPGDSGYVLRPVPAVQRY